MRGQTVRTGAMRRALGALAVAGLSALAAPPAGAGLPPDIGGDGLVARAVVEPTPPAAALPAALATRLVGLIAVSSDDPVVDGLVAFYGGRDNQPVWYEGGRPTAAAAAALARIARADEDGLDPAAYPRPAADFGSRGPEPAERLAAAEVAVSLAVARFAREAQAGRIAPRRISPLITLKPEAPDTVAVLRRVSSATDVAAALDGFNPPHAAFERLKAALATARREAEAPADAPEPVPAGPALKPGAADPRVEILRRRLALPAGVEPTLYDETVQAAVRAFQAANGLAADGVLGAQTVRVLNGDPRRPADRAAVILANMERWRWMPRDLGRAHVFVDIAGFTAAVVRDGAVGYRTRVVVGTPTTPTPVFSDAIRFVVVNPYWNVPLSIASKEMLPAIRANPSGYFSKRNYEVVVDGEVVSPAAVAWNEATIRRVRIRQRPGTDNALGSIKFMFPNEHAVYLHDTPSKALFERNRRDFSHGCVRVQDPIRFAESLLAEDPSLTARRIERSIGGREVRFDLKTPVPVHLAYFTVVAGPDGRLDLRTDIYGLDQRMIRALALRP